MTFSKTMHPAFECVSVHSRNLNVTLGRDINDYMLTDRLPS